MRGKSRGGAGGTLRGGTGSSGDWGLQENSGLAFSASLPSPAICNSVLKGEKQQGRPFPPFCPLMNSTRSRRIPGKPRRSRRRSRGCSGLRSGRARWGSWSSQHERGEFLMAKTLHNSNFLLSTGRDFVGSGWESAIPKSREQRLLRSCLLAG